MRPLLPLLLLTLTVACGGPEEQGVPPADVEPTELTPAAVHAAFASADPAEIEPCLERLRAWDQSPRTDLLVRGLAHPDRGVREWCAHALGDFAPREERVVDALLLAFDDDDDWVRWKAARALGLLGPFAKRALPLLNPAANAEQEVEVVRAAAQVAVQRIRGN